MPAVSEPDPATATTWTIDVNDVNGELAVDEVYIFVLIGLYFNPMTGTMTNLDKMATQIFAV